jgi:hypothetical protein
MTIDTKKVAGRRAPSFTTIDQILADVEMLDRGEIESLGNWTPAQIVEHVALFMDGSLDGFGFKAPLPLRMLGRVLRARGFTRPIPPGFSLRGKIAKFAPDANVTWRQAVDHLRRVAERVRGGARMTAPSPMFGALTHEEWVSLHCRHAELHFSFMRPAKPHADGEGLQPIGGA